MDNDKILELLFYTLPALITGAVAFYFFQQFVKNEDNRRRFLLMKENQRVSLPLRLQAYERMTLFLERIDPMKLLTRLAPYSNDKNEYENYIVAQIEQEFEHNYSQQIYMSAECWSVIMTAKNATIQMIRRSNMGERVDSADKLRETILNDLFDKATPSSAALAYIKNEVKDFI